MSRPKNSTVDLSSIGPELASLRAIAGDDMMAKAMEIARARLKLTPERLALMIVRAVAPDLVLCAYEEEEVRDVSKNALTAMKQRGEIPQICGGVK